MAIDSHGLLDVPGHEVVMRLALHEDPDLRIYLESHAGLAGKPRELVVVIEGTKSTRDVHLAYALAEAKLRGLPYKVARVDVNLDQAGARAVRKARQRRAGKQATPKSQDQATQ